MTARTMHATAGVFVTREHAVTGAIRSLWTALRAMRARASARRRLARSIAHLDDRMLADARLTPQDRGLGDSLIRGFAAVSEIGAERAGNRLCSPHERSDMRGRWM
jgi:hypothetical protein